MGPGDPRGTNRQQQFRRKGVTEEMNDDLTSNGELPPRRSTRRPVGSKTAGS